MIIELLRLLGLFYIFGVGAMYFLSSRGKPVVLPGDVYRMKGNGGFLYLPIGSALYIAIILMIIFKSFF